MSASSQTEQTYACQQCGEDYPSRASVGGSFCSERCLYTHRGRKALNTIASDHRWCATCFRQVKTTHRPPDSDLVALNIPRHIRETFVGYQYTTDNATTGVDESEPEGNAARRTTYTRVSCECGAVDTSDQHEVLRGLDPAQTIESLWACLVRLEADGTLQHRPTRDAYIEALRETDLDWTYAIGRALYVDSS